MLSLRQFGILGMVGLKALPSLLRLAPVSKVVVTSTVPTAITAVAMARTYASRPSPQKASQTKKVARKVATKPKANSPVAKPKASLPKPKRSPKPVVAAAAAKKVVNKVQKQAKKKVGSKKPKQLTAMRLFMKENKDSVANVKTGKSAALRQKWRSLPELRKQDYAKRVQQERAVISRKARGKIAKSKRSSGYQIFQRENYATAPGTSISEKAKTLAAKWKSLPASDKAKYIKRSQSDEGVQKRLKSGYMLFVVEKLKAAKGNHPEVMKAAGQEWKTLPEVQKKTFVDRAKGGEGAVVVMKSKPKSQRISGYHIYWKENYGKVQGALGERAKLLASNWKNLSQSEKDTYNKRSMSKEGLKQRRISGYQLYMKEKLTGVKGNTSQLVKTAAGVWKQMLKSQKDAYAAKAKTL